VICTVTRVSATRRSCVAVFVYISRYKLLSMETLNAPPFCATFQQSLEFGPVVTPHFLGKIWWLMQIKCYGTVRHGVWFYREINVYIKHLEMTFSNAVLLWHIVCSVNALTLLVGWWKGIWLVIIPSVFCRRWRLNRKIKMVVYRSPQEKKH